MKYSLRKLGASTGPGGRAYRARSGMLFASSSADIGIERLNRLKGRFANTQGQIAEVNRRLASTLVDLMIEELGASIVRPGVSTGRLARALEDPRNRRADQFGLGVGNPEFLDASAAKYWRAIELGTRKFVGKKIRGVWGDSLTGAYGGRGKYGPYPLAAGPFTAFGQGAGGRLRPMGRAQAYKALRESGAVSRGGGRMPAVSGIITQPIEPHLYMRNAWDRLDIKARSREVVAEVFRDAGLPIPKPSKGRRRR